MGEDNKKIFARNLSWLMQANQIDRYQLCDALGFKYSTVSEWLAGKKFPRVDKLEMLANYFKTSKSALIEDNPEEQKSAPADDSESKEIKEIKKKLNQLSDAEIIELSDFIDYLLSRREKRTDAHSV